MDHDDTLDRESVRTTPPTAANPWHRDMQLRVDRAALDERADDDDRLPIALSSEHPVRRYDWREGEWVNEVLDHSADSVDLSRVEDGAPFLDGHDTRRQIGLLEDMRVDNDRIVRGMLRFGAHPDASWIRADMESGIRTKVSVGYVPDLNNSERSQEEGETPTLRIRRWTVLEGSSVAIPADPTVGVGRGIDRGAAPATPTPSPDTAPSAEERSMEDDITAASEARDQARKDIAEITRLAHQHGMSERAGDWIEEGLSADQVGRAILAELAKRNAPDTAPAPQERDEDQTPAPAVIAERTKDEPGLEFGRALFYLARGHGDPSKAEDLARRAKDTVGIRALSAGDEVQGGFLVQDEVSSEVVELLRPMSVVRQLNPVIVPMDSGSLAIPKLAGGANAAYIGENRPAGATGQTFGAVKFEAKKLAALVPISNDLLRRANPATDRIIRDDTVASLAERSDLAFIRGAGTSFTPKGLRYQAPAAHVLTMTATPDLAKVTKDLHRMIQTLEEAEVKMRRPGWLMAPRTKHYLMALRDGNGNYAFKEEMLRGELLTYPYRVTTQIPKNLGSGSDESELYLADFADVVIGESMSLLVSMSDSAAYVDASSTMQSAFSNDQTVMRVLQEHDLQMRHDESIVVLDTLTWSL